MRALLLLCFSAIALLLSLTSLSLGQAVSARVNEVIKSSSGEPCYRINCKFFCTQLMSYERADIVFLDALRCGASLQVKFQLPCTSMTGSPSQKGCSKADIEKLPEPVKRYLKYTLQTGQSGITFCSLKQNGVFRYSILCTQLTNGLCFGPAHGMDCDCICQEACLAEQ